MPHVNKPYLSGDTWMVVITDSPFRGRTLEVIRCKDRVSAYTMYRQAKKDLGQPIRAEDISDRSPINWYDFWDWRASLKVEDGWLIPGREYKVNYTVSRAA